MYESEPTVSYVLPLGRWMSSLRYINPSASGRLSSC